MHGADGADASARILAELDALQRELAAGRMPDLDAAEARIEAVAAESGDPAVHRQADAACGSIRMARSASWQDAGVMASLPQELEAWFAGMPTDDPRMRPVADVLRALAEVTAAHARGEDVGPRLGAVRRAAGALPPGELRTMAEDALAAMSVLTSRPGEPVARPLGAGPDGGMAALHDTTAAMVLLQNGAETDLRQVERAIATLRRAMATAGDVDRTFHLTGLALGLFRHFELTTSADDLREARTLLEEARTLAGGPQHPCWQWTNEMLGEVRRLLGPDPHPSDPDAADPRRADAALEGLRGHMWQVLVQPSVREAAVVARDAAADAVAVARRCLAGDDLHGAISALDAGRGLALYSATAFATTAERLDSAGAVELAGRWRAALAGQGDIDLPAALRREVMTVLAEDGSAARLLDPPAPDEIQHALRTVDADALVYLVPRDDTPVGAAVVVPVEGVPSYLPLPGLAAHEDADVERYLSALAARDVRDLSADDADADDDAELSSSLDDLCDWAWRAAMGAVIEHCRSRRTATPARRPVRLVLVPMGELARIPWQAARRPDGVRAVQLVALSLAASARMLCHSAALAPVPTSPTGLIVADPDTAGAARDLPAARWEARAVRQSFYRGARLIGRRPGGAVSASGRGTGPEVRRWLADTDVDAGTMLHLACHGFVRAGGRNPSAHLLLADGDTVTAEELVELMAASPGRHIGLVVLAACRTGLSINGYDEAYSLGSAFLAAGARSVLSTHWAVPDTSTSVLMFMFHRYLRVEGRPVWSALHAAQLWMLDPAREIPEDVPQSLRDRLEDTDPTGVVGWAAFSHSGR
jgi:hypothetical protein